MSSPIGRFLAALHEIIPSHRAAEWDVSGLQIGDAAGPARVVGVCHEVTEEVVEAVGNRPVDLLVTYHPLLFRPTNRLVTGRSPVGRALRLIRAGTSVAVAHTSFDAAVGGTADALAKAVGLEGFTGFGPVAPAGQVKLVVFLPPDSVEGVAAAMSAAGAGQIGNYSGCSFRSEGIGAFTAGPGAEPVIGSIGAASRVPEVRLEMTCPATRSDEVMAALAASHPYEEPAFEVQDLRAGLGFIGRIGDLVEPMAVAELAELLAGRLGAVGWRVSGRGLVARRVGVVPGSGSSFLSAARAAGADVMVTGDVGHHGVREALDRGMAVIDPGHAAGERPGMVALADAVRGVCARLGSEMVDLTAFDPTPWR